MTKPNPPTNPNEPIKLTLRLPRPLWVRARRAQEQGLIPSIQEAATTALEERLTKLEKSKNK